MLTNRRDFIKLVAAGAATAGLSGLAQAAPSFKVKALAFDAFPIFNPMPIAALAETIFPGKGPAFMTAWRTRQFEYTWLRSMGKRYADFWKVTEHSLVYAAKATQLDLTKENRDKLLGAFTELKAWPDVAPALKALRAAKIRLGFLSNFTRKMLDDAIKSAGLDGMFEQVLTTDTVKTYKPDPRAYQLGIDAFKLKREEIGFVAFAGWDAAGAKWFGYPTLWVNRAKQPVEELEFTPDVTVSSLAEIVPMLGA
jgi:2-haloacid dehalogenase